jgi:hypothetical protein
MKNALELLKSNKSVVERAENYYQSVKRNIQRDVIDELIARKEKIEDRLFELTNFNLETDANAGRFQMTKEAVEERFKEIIDLEYEAELIEAELKIKKATFERYFPAGV